MVERIAEVKSINREVRETSFLFNKLNWLLVVVPEKELKGQAVLSELNQDLKSSKFVWTEWIA